MTTTVHVEAEPGHVEQARWWALGAMVLSTLAVGLDGTILSVALPTLAHDLHASTGQLQWFVDSYNLVLAAVLLPAGLLGDWFGRKRVLAGALVVFGLASAACAYAQSAAQLIGGRVLLALGAAFLMTLPAAILPAIFPRSERSRAISIWVTAMFASFPLGPIVGGLLLNNFWWGSVFLINVPVVIVAVIAVLALIPESRSAQAVALRPAGLLLFSTGLVAVTFAVIEAGERGWGAAAVLASAMLGGVLLAAFALYQRKAQARVARTGSDERLLIDLRIFSERSFTWGTALAVTGTFAMFGVLFSGPQYLQNVLGYDALGSGLLLLPMVGGLILGSRLAALADRAGTGITSGLGFALMAAGMFMGSGTTLSSGYGLMAVWLTTFGLGLGIALPTAMDAAMGAVPPERSGLGSGLLMSARMVGGAVGVAVLGSVFNSAYRSDLQLGNQPPALSEAAHAGPGQGLAAAASAGAPDLIAGIQSAFVHAMDTTFLVCAAIALAGAITGAVMLRGPEPERSGESEHDATLR